MSTIPLSIVCDAPARAAQEAACAACRVRRFCLPQDAPADHQGRPDARSVRLVRGAALYSAGTPVRHQVYVVRYGTFKQTRTGRCGAQVIVGFPGSGDVMGLEAIGLASHECSAVALESSEVCEIGYGSMRQHPQYFQGLISRNIRDMQEVLMQQRRAAAEQRLASFLLRRGAWHGMRGYSELRYGLPMARQDIADYLNMTPECLSRLLRKFQRSALISATLHEIILLDRAALAILAASVPDSDSHGAATRAANFESRRP